MENKKENLAPNQKLLKSDKMRKRRIILLCVLHIYFFILIIAKYQFCYYALYNSSQHDKIFNLHVLDFILLICLIMPIVLIIQSIILKILFGNERSYVIATFVAILFVFLIPYGNIARCAFLNKNITEFNNAVDYVLMNNSESQNQKIKLPPHYKNVEINDYVNYDYKNNYSRNYAYIIKENYKTIIYFEKGGIFSSKGFLYIPGDKKKATGLNDANYCFSLPVKGNPKGRWMWCSIDSSNLGDMTIDSYE